MFDSIRLADHVEAHLPGIGRTPVPGLIRGLDAIVGQDRADAIRNGLEQMLQKLPAYPSSDGFQGIPTQ